MGLFDKLTGSRAGNPGIAPVPAAELRSALMALGSGDWQVRDGADHHCDLVAEWHTVVEQDMGPGEGGLKAAFRVKMKFHEDEHEVHHNSEQSGSSWHTQTSHGMMNQPGGQFGGQAGFGNSVGYSADGQSGALGYNFNSSDIPTRCATRSPASAGPEGRPVQAVTTAAEGLGIGCPANANASATNRPG